VKQVESLRHKHRGASVSSSAKTDDDTEESSSDIRKVIQAFEESPVTKRKANAADYLLARKFLDPGGFKMTPEQVINGILLGTARKIGSDLENGTTAQVQSLAYFENSIMEAWTDKGLTGREGLNSEQNVRTVNGARIALAKVLSDLPVDISCEASRGNQRTERKSQRG